MLDKNSLDTLLEYTKAEIAAAESYFDSVRAPKILENYQIYSSDEVFYREMFPNLSKRSSLLSSDASDLIEWTLPALLKIFTGQQNFVNITPVSTDDIKPAEVQQQLINLQLHNLNPSFRIFYGWFKEALIGGLATLKVWWNDEKGTKQGQVILSLEELLKLQSGQHSPGVKVLSAQPIGEDRHLVTYSVPTVLRGFPQIGNIPPWEYLYNANCLDVHETPFACHRKEVTYDHLLKMARRGLYDVDAVNEIITNDKSEVITDLTNYKDLLRPQASQFTQPTHTQKAGQTAILYECYFDYDINNDGLLESIIVTLCENQILRVNNNNSFGGKPFISIQPMMLPYEPEGWGMVDVVKDIQHAKVALIRQILVNIALNNDPKLKIKNGSGVNMADLLTDRKFIRMDDLDAIQPLVTDPLAPWTFSFLEYLENSKERRTGVTRYNQGQNFESLSKTATGISLVMSAGQQRTELIARVIAETGMVNLFRFMVELNQKFISQEQVFRITGGEELRVSPEDIQGKFDYQVDAAALINSKEQQIQVFNTLFNAIPVLQKYGVITQENIYNITAKMLDVMGLKSVAKYITEPQTQWQEQGGMINNAGENRPSRVAGNQEQYDQTGGDGGQSQGVAGGVTGLGETDQAGLIQTMAAGGFGG